MNLFQIEQAHLDLIEELIENGGALTPEIEEQMRFSEDAFYSKMQSYALVVKQLNGETDLLADAIAELQKKKKQREMTVDTMKGRMLQAMFAFEKEKFKTPMVSVWIGKSKKLKIIKEADIPSAFLREVIEYKVEGAKLKEAIENGTVETDAAIVEETFNLQIR